MNQLDMIFQAIALFACVALILTTEPALNRCHAQRTRLCIRLALLLICAGSVLTVGAIIPGGLPTTWPGQAALASGAAIMLYTSRRRTLKS